MTRLAGPLDTLLDRTIAPGYTRLGLAVRRRLPTWPSELPRLDGRTVLVTGPTSGIGEAAASDLAVLGARVILLARNPDKAAATQARIQRAVQDADGTKTADVAIVRCDISSLASIREAVSTLEEQDEHVDVLVHNAGAMPPERTVTDEGFELAFATNVLGPFLLTALLEERLKADAPSRVITVSSGGMYGQKLDADDPQHAHRSYSPVSVYARNKRAQVVLGELWAQRLRGTGVVVHTMHPGWADTPGVQDSLPGFQKLTRRVLRSPAEGADTIVWLAAATEPLSTTGEFWQDRRRRPTHYAPFTREAEADRKKIWETCAGLAGVDAPVPA
ncbi:SDR family NAD(P)-dependent oxidoreductase [Patulibacter sp.]|uniref:SDR family NAD(P)-dependent oxidoreductase n=1 Tax=Patulibacter sp. TaxID=1912859 RepID=UPI00272889DA|nr:SDR family NAD(P)-dependent oxidoreductase [Patulibacter sp.]MDO9408533.1 SDR family NAD(P)-dependent oxidoreductase [Patulibacter sp.]